MIDSTLPNIPAVMGQSVINGVSRVSKWGFSKFMTAPLQNFALGAVAFAIAISTSNALFWQSGAHPAPMFAKSSQVAMNVQSSSEIIPLLTPPHPLDMAVGRAASARVAAQNLQQTPTIGASPAVPMESEVTNESLSKAQEVLASMGLFNGKVDGFYGPLTAAAIRSFESQNGMVAKGALSPEVINAIINAPANAAPVAKVTLSGEVAPASPTPQAIPVVPTVEQIVAAPQLATELLSEITANVALASVLSSVQPVLAEQPMALVSVNPQINKDLIEKIQSGLVNLGFYNSAVDGIAGESTAKAIRQFENFLSYPMTGDVNEQILNWLQEAGAFT